ncbi:MAG: hypothetical protein C0467_19120 [Planctomycetaceae bacterium]|nr:hypothetical protein [Planctomycetaceae bacterium]
MRNSPQSAHFFGSKPIREKVPLFDSQGLAYDPPRSVADRNPRAEHDLPEDRNPRADRRTGPLKWPTGEEVSG